jgi:hypothetical protein
MSENATTQSDLETVENMKGIKHGVEVQVGSIRRELALWLEQTRRSSQSTATTIALLETAFDHYLADHAHTGSDLGAASADAFDMIHRLSFAAPCRDGAPISK